MFLLFQSKLIEDFEFSINSEVSEQILNEKYQKIEEYVKIFPCGCAEHSFNASDDHTMIGAIHLNLYESLNHPSITLGMNTLDEKRRMKILRNLEALKQWVMKNNDLDQTKLYQTVKELEKIARILRQLAIDVNINY